METFQKRLLNGVSFIYYKNVILYQFLVAILQRGFFIKICSNIIIYLATIKIMYKFNF